MIWCHKGPDHRERRLVSSCGRGVEGHEHWSCSVFTGIFAHSLYFLKVHIRKSPNISALHFSIKGHSSPGPLLLSSAWPPTQNYEWLGNSNTPLSPWTEFRILLLIFKATHKLTFPYPCSLWHSHISDAQTPSLIIICSLTGTTTSALNACSCTNSFLWAAQCQHPPFIKLYWKRQIRWKLVDSLLSKSPKTAEVNLLKGGFGSLAARCCCAGAAVNWLFWKDAEQEAPEGLGKVKGVVRVQKRLLQLKLSHTSPFNLFFVVKRLQND